MAGLLGATALLIAGSCGPASSAPADRMARTGIRPEPTNGGAGPQTAELGRVSGVVTEDTFAAYTEAAWIRFCHLAKKGAAAEMLTMFKTEGMSLKPGTKLILLRLHEGEAGRPNHLEVHQVNQFQTLYVAAAHVERR